MNAVEDEFLIHLWHTATKKGLCAHRLQFYIAYIHVLLMCKHYPAQNRPFKMSPHWRMHTNDCISAAFPQCESNGFGHQFSSGIVCPLGCDHTAIKSQKNGFGGVNLLYKHST